MSKTDLEEILMKEAENTGDIHLYFQPESCEWFAYGRSADNLQILVPEIEKTRIDEQFPEVEMHLPRVSINFEQTERYNLAAHCQLIGDNYAQLGMEKNDPKQEVNNDFYGLSGKSHAHEW